LIENAYLAVNLKQDSRENFSDDEIDDHRDRNVLKKISSRTQYLVQEQMYRKKYITMVMSKMLRKLQC
jgi:hypothetical protein